MNKYEQRSLQERKSTMKVGLSLFAAAAILLFVVLVLTGYIGSMPKQPWQKATLIVAAVALVCRQVNAGDRRKTRQAQGGSAIRTPSERVIDGPEC